MKRIISQRCFLLLGRTGGIRMRLTNRLRWALLHPQLLSPVSPGSLSRPCRLAVLPSLPSCHPESPPPVAPAPPAPPVQTILATGNGSLHTGGCAGLGSETVSGDSSRGDTIKERFGNLWKSNSFVSYLTSRSALRSMRPLGRGQNGYTGPHRAPQNSCPPGTSKCDPIWK